MRRRLTKLGVPASSAWVTKLHDWVEAWNDAAQQVAAPIGPHTDRSYGEYLRYYKPRTRSRIVYPDMTPQAHQASSEDTYPYHRDEALAGAVSNLY